jgi:excisionase family DNA binding protein
MDRHLAVGRARVPGRERGVVSQQNNEAGVPASLPEVLTVEEAAAFLRVNRKTFYEAVRLGSVPGVIRLGRVIRISKSALISWVQGNGGPALGEKR